MIQRLSLADRSNDKLYALKTQARGRGVPQQSRRAVWQRAMPACMRDWRIRPLWQVAQRRVAPMDMHSHHRARRILIEPRVSFLGTDILLLSHTSSRACLKMRAALQCSLERWPWGWPGGQEQLEGSVCGILSAAVRRPGRRR